MTLAIDAVGALTVETGTGSADSDCYISVADCTQYHATMGNTNWATLTNTEMEQAIRRAAAYMEGVYRTNWKGTRLYRTQAMSWPRYGVCVDGYDLPSDEVPAAIAIANADLAFKAAGGELAPDIARAVIREKVGPLETQYSEFSSQVTSYRAIDLALSPYLQARNRLMRA